MIATEKKTKARIPTGGLAKNAAEEARNDRNMNRQYQDDNRVMVMDYQSIIWNS